jgi:micrococcal nuclease
MSRDRRASAISEGLFVLVMSAFLTLPAAACGLAMDRGAGPGASPSPAGGPLRPNGSATGVVVSTVDGDTIHVRVGGREEKVRLIGMDTPEVDWYGGRAQCYGAAAGLFTRQRLLGRTIRLRFDSGLRDVYGRYLAYVYLGRELFNVTLVRLGFATEDPVPPDTRMETTFADAEAGARAAGRGLWSACRSG